MYAYSMIPGAISGFWRCWSSPQCALAMPRDRPGHVLRVTAPSFGPFLSLQGRGIGPVRLSA